MKKQVLPPTMQHGEEADLGAEMFGIGSNGAQGFGCVRKRMRYTTSLFW